MIDETVKEISERADSGIVASVWRSGKNIGICFSKRGNTVTWDEMTKQDRVEAVQNFYAAADFFVRFVTQGKPDGLRVEQLIPRDGK